MQLDASNTTFWSELTCLCSNSRKLNVFLLLLRRKKQISTFMEQCHLFAKQSNFTRGLAIEYKWVWNEAHIVSHGTQIETITSMDVGTLFLLCKLCWVAWDDQVVSSYFELCGVASIPVMAQDNVKSFSREIINGRNLTVDFSGRLMENLRHAKEVLGFTHATKSKALWPKIMPYKYMYIEWYICAISTFSLV